MTDKAGDNKEIARPKEAHPAPEAAQKGGVIADPEKNADWKATQRARILAQEHSATDLMQEEGKPKPKTEKFEIVDAAAKRKELLARAKEQENTGTLLAKEAKKNPAAEPLNLLKQWADKLPAGPDKERFEELVRQEAASLSPELQARIKGRGRKPSDDAAAQDGAGNSPRRDHGGTDEHNKREPHDAASAGHPTGWMEVGQKLASLPLQSQVQIIGAGLMAGVEQYNHEQSERRWGALIGTVQGIGHTAENLAKIADFSAYCILGDKERAGKMGADFGNSLGQTIVSGVNVFEAAKKYSENIQQTGDVSKPVRDVIALGQMLDREWEKLPPREQERQKFEIIGQMVSDGLVGQAGAQAMGKATKFTEILDCIAKAGSEPGARASDAIKKAVTKISNVVQDLTSPEMALPGGGSIKLNQLEKGEQQVLKMVGRSGEYLPEHKPLFLGPGGKTLLKDEEIEAMGGLKKLESMSPQELEKIGLKRYEMPKLELKSDHGVISATVPKDVALFTAVVPKDGVVEVTYIRKGLMPEGAGAHFLAAALKAHDAIPKDQIILKLIRNPETLDAFRNHKPPQETLLGRHVIKALKELGLVSESLEFVPNGLNLEMVIKIRK